MSLRFRRLVISLIVIAVVAVLATLCGWIRICAESWKISTPQLQKRTNGSA